MENHTNGQKETCNMQQARSFIRLVIQNICSEVAISLHFSLKLNLAKRYTDNNTNNDCNILKANMEKLYLYVCWSSKPQHYDVGRTEITACVLHDLTAKIIRTPPGYRFVFQVHKIILKNTT